MEAVLIFKGRNPVGRLVMVIYVSKSDSLFTLQYANSRCMTYVPEINNEYSKRRVESNYNHNS